MNTDMNFAGRELETLKFWNEHKIFSESVLRRESAPVFTFYDGPPTANGKPHIGHVLTRAVKDAIPRYRTMKGYKVLRKAGWDTHGLPVELEVEKQEGISGKPDIEAYGIEPFIKKCKESVWKYENEWREMSERVGFWADMDAPYVTYHNEYIESVWWSLKKIWEKGLLYKGHKVVPYCPRCGTALSSHEVAQGYKDVREVSVFVKFKVRDKENEYFLAWTTTPWTLPSNVALVVNAKENYARVKYGDETYILAEALAPELLGNGFETLGVCTGAELEGERYEPLYDFAASDDNLAAGFKICCDGYVTLTDGTGIVHTAPAFGEDDARVGGLYKLPFVQLVDTEGKFVEDAYLFKGMFVKEADPVIIKDLDARGLLFREVEFEHNYPFCWRCDTPLIYYARDAWFIKMTAVRDELVANNDTINWYPDNIKKGRFGNFLENVIDWALSRERYWGTPLPVWVCECGAAHAVGSVKELKEMASADVPDGIELHKPYIDRVFLKCPACGADMKRTPEVIDCWYDAGSMPFAQWHYPFENEELFKENFPADFISEAMDQTRGWFYTLLAISTAIFGCASYKNCIVLGLVSDKDGIKMSKHLGNVVDPWDVLKKQGADAVRWYFYVSSALWLSNRFSEEAVSETQRKFIGTFWNTCAFYVLYAEIDGFDPTKHAPSDHEKLSQMDKWILSKLNTLIKYVDFSLENYRLTEAARALADFTDELSNWYVRRCRERFWAPGMGEDKINAYMTLYKVLTDLAKLSAPFVPFLAEDVYQNLVKSVDGGAPVSVHLCDFPAYDAAIIDAELEKNMELTLDIVILGRAARNAASIKTRQPLNRMFVKSETAPDPDFHTIIADELNVGEIVFTDDISGYASYGFKPQLKTVGPKYGRSLPKINEALREGDGNKFMKALTEDGELVLTIDGERVRLAEGDLIIETLQKEGYVTESAKGSPVAVVLETLLTPELIEEGFVRELISKLQTMRKEAGFEVTDRITAGYLEEDGGVIEDVFARNADEIKKEVLADAITRKPDGYVKRWSVNGRAVTLGVRRALK